MKKISAALAVGAVALWAFAMLGPAKTSAAVSCTFTRDLSLGSTGEDVRCLQKYLNDAGYTIATSGVGSPGEETSLFREKTQDALIKWQKANSLTPAVGTFGPLSRAKYKALMGGSTTGAVTPTTPAVPSGNAAVTIEARVALLAAIGAYDDATEEGVDDKDLEEARDTLFDAFIAFLNANLSQAKSLANSAERLADEAIDEGGNNNDDADDGDADDAIDELEENLEEAQEDFEDADSDDQDTGDAEDLLDDASDLLDDAKDAFDDEDYDEVMDLVEEAQDLIDEALDEIDGAGGEEGEAEDLIDDAEKAISDAQDAIDQANEDDEDTDEAEDLLDDAKDAYDDARDAYDDEDWEEAIDKAEEAIDFADEAEDAL